MACEGFEKSLIEEALASTDPALMAHLAVCGDCRAELAAQRELQGHITAGIAAMVADEPSSALLTRVRAQIAAEPAPRSMKWMRWAATGAAVAALAAVALWFAARPSFRPDPMGISPVQSAKDASLPAAVTPQPIASQQPAQSQAAVERKQIPARHVSHSELLVHTSTTMQATQPTVTAVANAPRVEIIVPAGQREAVLRLINALRTGRVDAASLLRAAQPGDLAPLAIAPIEVKPVNGSDEDDGTGNQLENEF